MSLPGVPAGCRTVTPHLIVRGGAEAIAFYEQAFGAKEIRRMPMPDGKHLMFAEIEIGDSRVFLNDEFPQMNCVSPLALGNTPVTIHLFVPNVDAAFERAVAAGATAVMPPQDMFWGDRYGLVADPFGHRWSIATPIDKTNAESVRHAEACAGGLVA